MSNEKKITDEQLEKEIRKGRSQKEIAYDRGYSYPSKTLSDRAEDLGYKKNYVAKVRSDSGVNIYVPPSQLQEVMEKSGAEFVDKNGDDALAYSFVRVTNDGCLVLKPYSKPWRKVREDVEKPDNSKRNGNQ